MSKFDEIDEKEFETLTLQLYKSDVALLLETLNFAQRASSFLATEESRKGSVAGAKKMRQYAENSAALYRLFYANYDIGEPPTNQSH